MRINATLDRCLQYQPKSIPLIQKNEWNEEFDPTETPQKKRKFKDKKNKILR